MFGDFRKMARWPLYRAVRCRYKTIFSTPSGLTETFFYNRKVIPARHDKVK